MSDAAKAIERMRSYPDGSYMRCPFCGCKSATHMPDCPIEVVATALIARSEKAALTPEQKAAWRALGNDTKDTVSGACLAFAAMMEKDYGISKAQAVKMIDIAYDVNGATK